jgi:hypothetical protein
LAQALSKLHSVTLKLVALPTLPPGVTRLIAPVIAPAGTVAVILVSESTVKVAFFPQAKTTSVAPVKDSPAITTVAPSEPLVGEKLRICGVTRKALLLVRVPPRVVTVTEPVAAPAGTVAFRKVSDSTVNAAALPLKETWVVR